MNLGQTGLLPEKLKIKGQRIDVERENKAWNDSIDQIAQIPFDPVKFVEVDEAEAAILIIETVVGNQTGSAQDIAQALAANPAKWLKRKDSNAKEKS